MAWVSSYSPKLPSYGSTLPSADLHPFSLPWGFEDLAYPPSAGKISPNVKSELWLGIRFLLLTMFLICYVYHFIMVFMLLNFNEQLLIGLAVTVVVFFKYINNINEGHQLPRFPNGSNVSTLLELYLSCFPNTLTYFLRHQSQRRTHQSRFHWSLCVTRVCSPL